MSGSNPRSTSILAGFLGCCALFAASSGGRTYALQPLAGQDTETAAGTKTGKALRVFQTASGIPDARPGYSTREVDHVLTISDDGKRLVLEQYARSSTKRLEERLPEKKLVLRLDFDPPLIWDIHPDGSSYRETAGNLNKFQKDRRRWEQELVRKAKLRPRAERDSILAANHVRLDGKRFVEVEHGTAEPILDRNTEQLKVTENGRTIIDCSISEEIGGGRSFFSLYRRLGAFSEEVLERLENVQGLPLKGTITVVAKLSTHKLGFEVKKFEDVEVPDSFFELPRGAQKIVDKPSVLVCDHCGKKIETKKLERFLDRGTKYSLCSRSCRKKLSRELIKKLSEPKKK